jgi:hypothetical protein
MGASKASARDQKWEQMMMSGLSNLMAHADMVSARSVRSATTAGTEGLSARSSDSLESSRGMQVTSMLAQMRDWDSRANGYKRMD